MKNEKKNNSPLRTLKGTICEYKKRQVDEDIEDNNPFFFKAEISNTNLDSYYSRMDISTLQNFAKDASNGVMLQDSHDYRKLGYGQSFSGLFEEERVLAEFYTVPGIRFGGSHSFATTDDFIRAVETAIVRDVSVGFHGGREICDICGLSMWSWECPHFPGKSYIITDEDGEERVVVATYTIYDARLAEVSVVFDGATPQAQIIRKVQDLYTRNKISEKEIRGLEKNYQVRILADLDNEESDENLKGSDTVFYACTADPCNEQEERDVIESSEFNEDEIDEKENREPNNVNILPLQANNKGKNSSVRHEQEENRVMTLKKLTETLENFRNQIEAILGEETPEEALDAIETVIEDYEALTRRLNNVEKELEEVTQDRDKYQDSSKKYKDSSKEYKEELDSSERTLTSLEKIRDELEESETIEELPQDLVEAVELVVEQFRSVSDELSERTAEKKELDDKVAELEPLAEVGSKYREKAIANALKAGNKAYGDDFDEEKRRTLLENSPFDIIEEFTDAWQKIAESNFAPSRTGRKVREYEDEDENDDEDSDQKRYEHIPRDAYR